MTGAAAAGSSAPATTVSMTGSAGAVAAGSSAPATTAGAAAPSGGGPCPAGFVCDANPVGDPAMVCKMMGSQIPPMCTTAADCSALGTTCTEVSSGFSLCVLACN
jgi:hypothetical protein